MASELTVGQHGIDVTRGPVGLSNGAGFRGAIACTLVRPGGNRSQRAGVRVSYKCPGSGNNMPMV